jgi:hypothetical protein
MHVYTRVAGQETSSLHSCTHWGTRRRVSVALVSRTYTRMYTSVRTCYVRVCTTGWKQTKEGEKWDITILSLLVEPVPHVHFRLPARHKSCQFVCVCIYIYIYIYIYMYVCMCVCMYVCVCVCIYIYIYIYIYVCMCIYICMYVCMYNWM